MKPIEALIIDDCPLVRTMVSEALERDEFVLTVAATGEEGLQVVKRHRFEVILLDLHLPGMQGLEVLATLRELAQPPEVVVLTGHPELDTAVQAVKAGACDYLSKPFDPFKLIATLRNAAAKYRLRREVVALEHTVAKQYARSGGVVVAESPAMKRILGIIDRVAPSEASILIRGETGAGKGLVAKLIHSRSARSHEPHLHINCGALSDTLLESELFGHEKGSFTGAASAKPGLFEVADGGTLFLDEVAETSPAMQAKLLQVLDSGELRRVGGTSFFKVDVRILSATNKDLQEEITAGRFRRDLFYRLNVVGIDLPPLRERREDIPGLVRLYLDRHRLPGEAAKAPTEEALRALCNYSWPGNVRELANVIEGIVLLAPGERLDESDLPQNILSAQDHVARPLSDEPASLAQIQAGHVLRTLRYTRGIKAHAARLLGIDVKTLGSKIKKYGIAL
ncbi:MAG: sigma-54-dependent Fis family transcriptional regulator [bacterium]|nr:sigma-54-dependent Fis family transcriptional regulator [bacterium]